MTKRSHKLQNIILLTLISAALILILTSTAEARDLVEAMTSAQTLLNRIGIAAISIGITVGGIMYALGAAMMGRMVLISGFVGACAILGAPAIISLVAKIFGMSI